jgi:6-phosphogluconate dehydrogenase
MKIGIVGLGTAGARLTQRALERGLDVAGFDKGGMPRALMGTKLEDAPTLEALAAAVGAPRFVFLCTDAGPSADEAFLGLRRHLTDGDVLLDATPSHWRDCVRRYRSLRARGLRLVDLGLLGEDAGPWSIMAGGDLDAFAAATALLDQLAGSGKAAYVGPPGAGRFAALLAEAVELAMRQSIVEGLALVERSDYRFDLEALLSLWQAGAPVKGAVLEKLLRGLGSDLPSGVNGPAWIVEQGLELGSPVPLLALARFAAAAAATAPAPIRAPTPSPTS